MEYFIKKTKTRIIDLVVYLVFLVSLITILLLIKSYIYIYMTLYIKYFSY